MPHQLTLFVHWLCAFPTASTTFSRLIPGAVAPIHHFLVLSQYIVPIDAWDELSHFTSDPVSAGVTAYAASGRTPQHPRRPEERHRKDMLVRVAVQAGESAPVSAEQRAAQQPPGQPTTGSLTAGGDPERELASDRGVEGVGRTAVRQRRSPPQPAKGQSPPGRCRRTLRRRP